MDLAVTPGRRARMFIQSSPPSVFLRIVVHATFVVYAVTLLFRIEYGLLRRPLTVTCRGLGLPLSQGTAPDDDRDLPWAELHRSAVRAWRVLAWWPFNDTCLRRCLLLGAVMRDHRPELVIGVRRDDSGAVLAHSWLLFGDRSIDPTSPRFSAFATE